MAGLKQDSGQEWSHEQVQEWLEWHIEQGGALPAEVQAHLTGCAGCRAHLRLLQEVQLALLEDVPELAPPPELRAQVLQGTRIAHLNPPARRWWPAALGAAAVLSGLLALGALLTPSQGVAASLPDPAVVVHAGGPLIIASNDRRGTISVVQGGKVTASLPSGGAQSAWFTEGVRLGSHIYLADAANNRVLEVQAQPLRVVKVYPVPDGVAGLTATSDAQGGRVYFKSVRGAVGELGGKQINIAHEPGMPLADVMDGVLLANGTLYVTHHLSGEVCLLDPQTLAERGRVKVGGMPVALEAVQGDLLALDVTGRLLKLNLRGQVVQAWKLPGHPDKLSVNGDLAVVSDRAGMVTRISLPGGSVQQTPVTHPMDVIAMPGGRFAVAEGGRGLRVLDGQLNTMSRIENTH